LLCVALVFGEATGNSVTYQGQLKNGGLPANGAYDIEFSLHNDATGGVLVAGPIQFDGNGLNADAVDVVNGLFSVGLDFGDVFDGTALWLEVRVRPHGTDGYTTLSPRQPLTAAPFALYAMAAPGGSGKWSTNGSDIFNNNTGNVGVGTSSPQTTLDVFGENAAVRIESIHNNYGPKLVFRNRSGGTGIFRGTMQFQDANDTLAEIGYREPGFGVSRLSLVTVGGGMAIFDDGEVGIGDAPTADAPLHVHEGSAGNVTTLSASSAVFERSANNYVSIVSPSNRERGVIFGDPAHGANGGIVYNNAATPNGLQFRANGNTTRMAITSDGDVGIGTDSPYTKLHIVGGTDASFSSVSGFLIMGNTAGSNVVMDNNEIMARNNGATAPLYLNNDGGDVVIGGTLDIGYETVRVREEDTSSATATCPSGKRVIGGGCAGPEEIRQSDSGGGSHSWFCVTTSEASYIYATAICARVK
jgi:hypothetical protein